MTTRNFVWYELMTPDRAGSEAFYSAVVGWNMVAAELGGGHYALGRVGERPTVGLMQMSETCDANGPPCWLGYVGVDDVAATVERVKGLGGALVFGPMAMAGVGSFAVVTDPQGAAIGVFAPEFDTAPLPMMSPGSIGWHELYTTAPEAAFDFYAELFGWTKDVAYPMPPQGVYQLFATDRGAVGGMMRNPQGEVAFWGYVFAVADIDAAATRLREAGGTIVNGPMEVPGGAFVIQATDPQGVFFSLVGMRTAA